MKFPSIHSLVGLLIIYQIIANVGAIHIGIFCARLQTVYAKFLLPFVLTFSAMNILHKTVRINIISTTDTTTTL